MSRSAPPPREHYAHFMPVQTRWMDNDVYGHVNNVVYYSYFDTVINAYLVEHGGLDIGGGEVIGVCAESACRYVAPSAYPEHLEAGLAVSRLGRSSVTYEVGIFGEAGDARAFGHFVHVFVARESRRPSEIPERLRAALARLSSPG